MSQTNSYRQALHQTILASGSQDEAVLQATQSWYTSGGRDEFLQYFEYETALKLSGVTRSNGALVEHAYPKNVNEYADKTEWNEYYVANALIALHELDKIFAAVNPVPSGCPDIFYHNLVGLLKHLFLDTIVLIDDWATFQQKVPGVIGIGKNRLEHSFAIYQSALQVVYGNHSPFSFADNHSDTSINQLRMCIEMRLRRGFGVSAKLNVDGAIVPLALSELITAIRPHKQLIDFSVPFAHIERIYGWSNIYMHSGLKQYSWSPIYALFYLRRFLIGGKHAGGTSMNAGMITSEAIVQKVQADLETGSDNAKFSLVLMKPGDCDVILNP
jgi:hypothetical protein